jgi:peptide/nickel transport system permease protein
MFPPPLAGEGQGGGLSLPGEIAETPVSQPVSLRRLLRTYPRVAVSSVLLLLLILVTVLAPWIALHDPIATDPSNALLGPSGAHLLGTDELGRDLFARVIWGSRVSLPVAFVAVAVGLLVGGSIGLVAGYRGGATDLFLMRVIDAILAFPALILAVAIVAVLGPGLRNAMIAIGITQLPVYARLMRAQVLTLKGLDFVAAVRVLGASPARLIVHHFLPNLLNPLIVQISLSAAAAMLAEATLSFLGLGAQPPAPDWGFMMNTGARFLNNDAWLALGPGVAISIAVFAFNWLGDALRDALDPRLRQ